jgi:hypothetical protein
MKPSGIMGRKGISDRQNNDLVTNNKNTGIRDIHRRIN